MRYSLDRDFSVGQRYPWNVIVLQEKANQG